MTTRTGRVERYYAEHPEARYAHLPPEEARALADADAARRAAFAAVPIPDDLRAPADVPTWQRQAYNDAADLYRALYLAPARQAKLSTVGRELGRDRRAAALKVLRASSAVGEEKRVLPDASGRVRAQVVLFQQLGVEC